MGRWNSANWTTNEIWKQSLQNFPGQSYRKRPSKHPRSLRPPRVCSSSTRTKRILVRKFWLIWKTWLRNWSRTELRRFPVLPFQTWNLHLRWFTGKCKHSVPIVYGSGTQNLVNLLARACRFPWRLGSWRLLTPCIFVWSIPALQIGQIHARKHPRRFSPERIRRLHVLWMHQVH